MKYRRILLLCAAIALGALSGCDGSGMLATEEYLERAKSNLQAQDFQGVVVDLKFVLQSEPDHLEARQLLGKAYINLGDAVSAEKELARARSLGAPDAEVQLDMARALLMQRKYEEVLAADTPGEVQAGVKAEWLAIQGHALLAQDEKQAAANHYSRALEADKNSLTAALGLARLDLVEKQYATARKRLNQLLSRHDKYAAAWRLLGDVERVEGRLEEAELAYTKVIENDATSQSDIITRCLVRIALKKYSEANADIAGLKSQGSSNPLLGYAEGLLYFQQQRYADAQLAFEQVLYIDSQYPPALFYAGATHIVLGNYSTAEQYLSRYLSRNPDHAVVQMMLAVTKLQGGNSAEVETLAREILRENPDDVFIMNLLANVLMQQNKGAEEIKYLKQVVATQPESALARERLGISLIGQGDESGGIDELEKALKLDPRIQEAGARLVLIYLEKGELDLALEKALDFREMNPNAARAHIILGVVYLSQEKPAKAAEALQKAIELEPANAFAHDRFADLAVAAKDPEKAKRQFLAILEAQPGHLGALLGLARVEAMQGDVAAMKAILEKAMRLNPRALNPYLQLGRYYLQAGEADRAIGELAEIRGEYPRNQALLELQAQSELAIGRYKLAEATLQDLAKTAPDSIQLHFLLASCYAGLGDGGKSYTELTKVIELDPGHVPARMALARLMLEQNKIEQAETYILTLKRDVGASAEVLVLEGHLAALKQDMRQAIAAFQQTFELEPGSHNLILLSRSRWAAGDRQAALKDLTGWVMKHSEDALIQFELAQRYLDLHRNEDAIRVYRKVVKLTPENFVALNNLAWLLREQDPAIALEYAEQASWLAPKSLSVLDTLALVLLASGDPARAGRIINRALELQPGQPGLVYHQAMILEASARRDEAIKVLKSILGNDHAFPERDEAESLLESLSGS